MDLAEQQDGGQDEEPEEDHRPVDRHPVSDVTDATDITKVKVAMNCLTCHQPHASAQPGLLAKDQANNSQFCATCHKDLRR